MRMRVVASVLAERASRASTQTHPHVREEWRVAYMVLDKKSILHDGWYMCAYSQSGVKESRTTHKHHNTRAIVSTIGMNKERQR